MVYSTRQFVLCLTLCYFVLVFSVLLALWLPSLGKRELILVLFVCLFDLCLFCFVGFLFLLVSWKGCGLWMWRSLDFTLTFFKIQNGLHNFNNYVVNKPGMWWCSTSSQEKTSNVMMLLVHKPLQSKLPFYLLSFCSFLSCISTFFCSKIWLVILT